MGRIVSYQALAPSSFLTSEIQRFYKFEYKHEVGSLYTQGLLPDACSGIFFSRGAPIIQLDLNTADTNSKLNYGILAYSQLTRKLKLQFTGDCTVYGILFKPLGLDAFFSCDLDPMRDCLVSGPDALPSAELLFERVASETKADSLQVFASKCQNVLTRLALERNIFNMARPWLHHMIIFIYKHGWSLPLQDYYQISPVGVRRCQTIFQEKVGCSLKTFLRILRFHHFFKHCKHLASETCFSRLAKEYGYFDEAHLCHDLYQFVSKTPFEIAKQNKIIYYG